MAAAAAAARSSSRAAGATETCVVRALFEASIEMEEIDQHSPCSVRVHGPLVITHEYRKIGDTTSRLEDKDEPPCFFYFDCRKEVADRSLFRNHAACRDLVHRMLAEGPVTGKYDLAAGNWDRFQPHDIATDIVAKVPKNACGCGFVPAYALDIEMPLQVRLIYSEAKALLLACKEAAAETSSVPARGRKRRRRETSAGELCAICLVDFQETQEEDNVRLPCAHAFHSRCILPWFNRVSTCPTCRRDAAIRHDAAVHEAALLETGEGNNGDTPPIQVDRPVRARRQPARLTDYSLA